MRAARIINLTALRFFLALWVLIFHWCIFFSTTTEPNLPAHFTIHNNFLAQYPLLQSIFFHLGLKGYLAVPIFFVLSGFVIFYNYQHTTLHANEYKAFICQRINKLYPIYIFYFLLISLLVLNHATMDKFLLGMLANILLIQNWLPNIASVLFTSWSLSLEWFAYLFIVPLKNIIAKYPYICALITAAIWLIVCWQTDLLFNSAVGSNQITISQHHLQLSKLLGNTHGHIPWGAIDIGALVGSAGWLSRYIMLCSACSLFIVGGLAAVLWFKTKRTMHQLLALLLTAIALAWIIIFAYLPMSEISMPLAALLLIICLSQCTSLAKFLELRFMRFLGESAYSIYLAQCLIHPFLFHASFRLYGVVYILGSIALGVSVQLVFKLLTRSRKKACQR